MSVKVDSSTLASGIGSLVAIAQARSKRIADISLAIATDSNRDRSMDAAAIAALNQEASLMQNLNDQTKKLQDALEAMNRTWTRA